MRCKVTTVFDSQNPGRTDSSLKLYVVSARYRTVCGDRRCRYPRLLVAVLSVVAPILDQPHHQVVGKREAATGVGPWESKLSVENAKESAVTEYSALNAGNRQVDRVEVMGVFRGCARSPGHGLISVQTSATGIAVHLLPQNTHKSRSHRCLGLSRHSED